MAQPRIIIVDEHDAVIGAATPAAAREKGLYHRIVRIMVEDDRGRILLQKRAPSMELYPNCWDHSAAGHVDEGETYDQAAARELNEELGIEGLPLQAIATYRTNGVYRERILNRFNKCYRVRFKPHTSVHAQPEEVSEVRWFTLDEIRRLIKDHPDQVTEGLVQVIGDFYPA